MSQGILYSCSLHLATVKEIQTCLTFLKASLLATIQNGKATQGKHVTEFALQMVSCRQAELAITNKKCSHSVSVIFLKNILLFVLQTALFLWT